MEEKKWFWQEYGQALEYKGRFTKKVTKFRLLQMDSLVASVYSHNKGKRGVCQTLLPSNFAFSNVSFSQGHWLFKWDYQYTPKSSQGKKKVASHHPLTCILNYRIKPIRYRSSEPPQTVLAFLQPLLQEGSLPILPTHQGCEGEPLYQLIRPFHLRVPARIEWCVFSMKPSKVLSSSSLYLHAMFFKWKRKSCCSAIGYLKKRKKWEMG